MDLGELGNYIEDEGVGYLAQLIRGSATLISLNITHNHITKDGLKRLVDDALQHNQSLIFFDYVQYGVEISKYTMIDMKAYLERNKQLFLSKHSVPALEQVVIPEHVNEIYSVYRTH